MSTLLDRECKNCSCRFVTILGEILHLLVMPTIDKLNVYVMVALHVILPASNQGVRKKIVTFSEFGAYT